MKRKPTLRASDWPTCKRGRASVIWAWGGTLTPDESLVLHPMCALCAPEYVVGANDEDWVTTTDALEMRDVEAA